jgi:hypothetical protein
MAIKVAGSSFGIFKASAANPFLADQSNISFNIKITRQNLKHISVYNGTTIIGKEAIAAACIPPTFNFNKSL